MTRSKIITPLCYAWAVTATVYAFAGYPGGILPRCCMFAAGLLLVLAYRW